MCQNIPKMHTIPNSKEELKQILTALKLNGTKWHTDKPADNLPYALKICGEIGTFAISTAREGGFGYIKKEHATIELLRTPKAFCEAIL